MVELVSAALVLRSMMLLVLAPAAVLSAIFALSAATWASLAGTAAAPAALAAGAACFAVAVIMLVRTGLREVARLAVGGAMPGAILAPYCASASASDRALAVRVAALREQGEIVVEQLPGTSGSEGPWCDRRLVESDGHWITQAIIKD